MENVFVILGIARSGTSVIAKALQTLGVDLGNKLTPPGKWNPTGFWEDNEIVYQINQRLLDLLQFRWDSIKLLEQDPLAAECQDIYKQARGILRQRLKETSTWGFKDPRTARIIPFWQAVFTELQIHDHYIIALRNPLCSANSFSDLGRNDIEKGLLLWLMHVIPAVEQTHGKKRIIVSYEKMLQDPKQQLTRLQQYFAFDTLQDTTVAQYADGFLNKKLDHYHYSYEDLIAHPATQISSLIVECYNCLLELAEDKLIFDDPAFSARWADIKNEFQKQYASFCYLDTLLQENHQLRKNLRSIQRSPSWKLIYPLRVLEKTLSGLRKQVKLQFKSH